MCRAGQYKTDPIWCYITNHDSLLLLIWAVSGAGFFNPCTENNQRAFLNDSGIYHSNRSIVIQRILESLIFGRAKTAQLKYPYYLIVTIKCYLTSTDSKTSTYLKVSAFTNCLRLQWINQSVTQSISRFADFTVRLQHYDQSASTNESHPP